jgi:hypothetical protein
VEGFFIGQYFKTNQEVIFLFSIVTFPILTRVLPLWFISSFFVIAFLLYLTNHFYFYVNNIAKSENKSVNLQEYSWGFVREEGANLDSKNFLNYLKSKKWEFYRAYLSSNKNIIILMSFLFGDLVVAFKNLSLEVTGAYFAMSIFTKFVFLAYIYINRKTVELSTGPLSVEEKEFAILDNFYKHFSGIASLSLVMFVLFFALGRYITEIFFGFKYIEYQTSLSFILLANMALLLGLIIFRTAQEVAKQRTWQLAKVFAPIIIVLFVFLNITHPDTVAFFVIGSVAVFSIFLYNFCIRKAAYIENTYNYLF